MNGKFYVDHNIHSSKILDSNPKELIFANIKMNFRAKKAGLSVVEALVTHEDCSSCCTQMLGVYGVLSIVPD